VAATATKREVLPYSLPPRGLSRVEASAYVGVGVTKFDEMVADGRMPRPKRIDARLVWDRLALDVAFSALPNGGEDTEQLDGDEDGYDQRPVA
jgi:predicted DNA-binding transcriptional regulator AlpA